MKKLLFANFLKDTVRFFIIICFSISAIVWVVQAVGFLDFVTEDGHSLYVYFLYSIHSFPKIINRVIPLVFFISLFYQINQYELRNELLIFWTIGISKLHFIKIIVLFSLFFTILQIIFGAFIAPKSQDKARSYIRNSSIDFFPSLLQRGKFIDTVKHLTIFIISEGPSGNYNNIFVKESFGNNNQSIYGQESQVIYAKNGKLRLKDDRRYLELFDGKVIKKDSRKINDFSFKRIEFDLMQYGSKTTSYPKIQELNNYLLIQCLSYYLKGISEKLKSDILTCNEGSSKDIKEEIFKRFYKPLYLPLLALMACLIIFSSKENKRYTFHKVIIFFFAILIIVISEICLRYNSQSAQGTYFFIFFPLLLFSSIFAFLIKKLKRDYI